MTPDHATIDALLTDKHGELTRRWLADVAASSPMGASSADATREAESLMNGLRSGFQSGADPARMEHSGWGSLRVALEALSKSRAAQGATAGETSHFVLALKKPLFIALQERLAARDPQQLFDAMLTVSTLLDHMAQWTATTYQATREDIIMRQQQELLELSTPVVKLWDGVLAVPMIGTLDSSRTQLVMESLLQRIVETGSEIAIIDITGVPTVDTLVAQHLLKTVTAIRLMGADCIISGVRPQIAQTIVHLGIDLQGIVTKASLADALLLALKKLGYVATRAKA
ncbi:STAS domain-containing protein [Variovorax robiniae]|uniref:STAS domain-containing protein n=1 Tax=Variovorax robiniae TaxID=1836199 RepID=A0ABU8XET5_9BURK